jgi:hypothetical protein
MRLDSMAGDGDNAFRSSESYDQFSALAWLADRTFPGKCANHWQVRFKTLEAPTDGTEPEPGCMGVFEMVWEDFSINIEYEPNVFGLGSDHIEVRKVSPAGFDLPITETGYRSIHPDRFEIVNAGGISAYICALLDQANTPASSQGTLF